MQRTINIIFSPLIIQWPHFRKLVEVDVIRSEQRFGTSPTDPGHLILLEEKTWSEKYTKIQQTSFLEWLPYRLERILKSGR